MGLFDRFSVNKSEEVILLKHAAKLTVDDIDRLVALARGEFQKEEHSVDVEYYMDIVKGAMDRSNSLTGNYNSYTRRQLYEIYDEMDESTSYISAALDILSDDAVQPDESGDIIHIDCENDKVVTLIEDVIREQEIIPKLAKWSRAIAKYGDLFVKVDGELEKGVTYINDTIYPSIIDRKDINGKLVAFANNQQTVYSNDDLYPPWEFVHFRHKGDIYKEESLAYQNGLNNINQFSNSTLSAYGQSVLKPAVKVYAQLRFVENLLLLSRLTNSIRRNIFLINTEETDPKKAFERVRNYADLLKKNIKLDLESQIYDSSKHTVSYDEDIFLPVNDTSNDIKIEHVGGDLDLKEAYDLDYLQNKLFSALKVPKAYLNYEQDLNARSTLIQLDIRYARSVSQLQQTIIAGLTRLFNIHLAYKGLNPDELEYTITLTSVSAIDDEARTEQLQNQINAARDSWDLITSMSDTLSAQEKILNLEAVAEYLMKDYLELDPELIDKVFGRDEETVKLNASKSIRSKKINHNNLSGDSRASYPIKNDKYSSYEQFEKIRESLLKISNSSSTKEEQDTN